MSSIKNINLEGAIISRKPDAISSNLDGEAVILDLESSVFYGLDEVGTRIWELLDKENSFDNIVLRLSNDYAVEHEQCRVDARQFIFQMLDQGLIEIETI